MRKRPKAIDGFVPRTSGRSIGGDEETTLGRYDSARSIDTAQESDRPITSDKPSANGRSISRYDVDESLKGIEDEERVKPKRRLFGLLPPKKPRKPQSRRRKLTKRVVKIILILALLAGAYVGVKTLLASTNIFNGNLLGLLQNKPLKTDKNGRTNVLIFGTSGSIEDNSHEGANLTDSLLVLSVDQNKKDAYILSLPRDLWVDMGAACIAGYQAKINSLYECQSDGGLNEEEGAIALQKKAAEVTGLEMQYYAHVNWAVLVDTVDAVGGIKVDVQGNGPVPFGVKPGSVLDRNFDQSCNYECNLVKYEPGTHKMNGLEALAFSRARNANGGYGFAGGNFDREKNQQKVLTAIKEKAVSAGTVTNIAKVTGLVDALGENLRTDFDTSEIRTLMSLAQDVPADKITSISLVDEEDPLVTNGNVAGQSIVQPVAGLFEYSAIKAYVNKKVNATAVTKEAAKVAVFNGANIEGYGGEQAARLEALGITVPVIDNAPAGSYKGVLVYDVATSKPATLKKILSTYSVTVQTGEPPVYVPTTIDIVVILGATPARQNQ